jgi:hypothetical protein
VNPDLLRLFPVPLHAQHVQLASMLGIQRQLLAMFALQERSAPSQECACPFHALLALSPQQLELSVRGICSFSSSLIF